MQGLPSDCCQQDGIGLLTYAHGLIRKRCATGICSSTSYEGICELKLHAGSGTRSLQHPLGHSSDLGAYAVASKRSHLLGRGGKDDGLTPAIPGRPVQADLRCTGADRLVATTLQAGNNARHHKSPFTRRLRVQRIRSGAMQKRRVLDNRLTCYSVEPSLKATAHLVDCPAGQLALRKGASLGILDRRTNAGLGCTLWAYTGYRAGPVQVDSYWSLYGWQ